jgi:carbon starvation protein
MSILLVAIGAFVGFIVAYQTYGRWLARKVFKLDADAAVPSIELNDDKDYVPTEKGVVFGHHFTSIAGTGPIVGPAIAVMWGWLPALLWVLFGAIFIGAVHDFGALIVSIRNRGQTVGDIAGRVLNKRVRLLFLFVLFMALTIVLAIFGLVIAAVFRQYPAAILPCLLQIPIAVAIGIMLHRKGIHLLWPSIITLALMYLSVIYGDVGILGVINAYLASWSIILWVVVLLIYSYVASVLPVWLLLQPRDYINSLQLLSALGLILAGLCCAAIFGGAPVEEGAARMPLEFVAPAIREDAGKAGAPAVIPFLFITIACGAISGFHCLVSSGTSSKQIKCESDAQFVGYGSMLTEGFLATLVILACTAGIGLGVTQGIGEGSIVTGEDAYLARYASWQEMGLAAKVGAFVDGSANFLKAMGIPAGVSLALMGVLVASFAGTTLDTACRLQRYVIQELASTFAPRVSTSALVAEAYDLDDNLVGIDRRTGAADRNAHTWNPLVWLTNKHGATIFAILLAAAIAALPRPGADWSLATAGTGGLILWPLFGATNQLLAGLAFLVITFYLWRRKVPVWFVALPMLFMLAMPAWAMIAELPRWISPPPLPDGTVPATNWIVVSIAIATVALEVWMIIEAVLIWPRAKGVLEESLPPLRPLKPEMAGIRSDARSC